MLNLLNKSNILTNPERFLPEFDYQAGATNQLKRIEMLNKLSQQIHNAAKEKGFYDNGQRNTGEMLMLVVSELSEALEADRNGRYANLKLYKAVDQKDRPSHDAFSFKSTIKDTFEDEIADAIIRLLDLCGYRNIDIDKHIELKMQYNASRNYKHGKKY